MGWLFGGKKSKRDRAVPIVAMAEEPAAIMALEEPASAEPASVEPPAPEAPTPQEALDLLREGNAAFLRGENNLGHVNVHDLDHLQGGQQPIATIVGCADSRTPPTILFN